MRIPFSLEKFIERPLGEYFDNYPPCGYIWKKFYEVQDFHAGQTKINGSWIDNDRVWFYGHGYKEKCAKCNKLRRKNE